jgi:fucose 4-O-acetylase-like acetyltransferase
MSEQKQRDPYFDNAKFLLVTLIVAGHAIYPLIEASTGVKAIYLLLYTFHIPMFAFVAGRFSRPLTDPGVAARTVTRVLVPYLIFEILYSIADGLFFTGGGISFSLLTPYSLMWFLLSLFFWRAMLVFFAAMKRPLLIAILLSLGIGYIEGATVFLSLSRTLVFFPFFLAGYHWRNEKFTALDRLPVKGAAIFILFATYLVLSGWATSFDLRWLLGRESYTVLQWGGLFGPVKRLMMLATGFGLGFAFLALVPRQKMAFTALGEKSIYIYLLHGFPIYAATAAGWYETASPTNAAVTALVAAGVLSIVLGSQRVVALMRPLVEPPIDRILFNDETD